MSDLPINPFEDNIVFEPREAEQAASGTSTDKTMPKSLSDLPINPFEDNIVFEPREAEQAIAGLNDAPLRQLLDRFARLEAAPPPRHGRLHPPLLAQLVTSAEPGYGKSHLIGRLFRALDSRATRIYLRPFQDAASSWRSILLKAAQELDRPDDPQLSVRVPGGLTQLDAFAHGVTAHLLAGLIEKGTAVCDDGTQRAQKLRGDPLAAFGGGHPDHYLAAWLRTEFANLLPHFVTELGEADVALHARPSAWLKVLRAYSYADGHGEQRAACLEWLKGEALSDEEASRIGLSAGELPTVEETAVGRNAGAMQRIQDLLALAGFYRPFLFCFDQTEMLTSSAELCKEFGKVMELLVAHGLNHMIVVTANLDPWNQKIAPQMEVADRERFSDPIEMTGINRAQAAALARQRLGDCGVDASEAERFCEERWLDGGDVFGAKPSHSVRGFLRLCAKRFSHLLAEAPPVVPEKSLDDYYRHYEREASNQGRLVFDPDVLRWCVSPECVGDALSGVEVVAFKDQKGYFSILWRSADGSTLFGFEDSSNWKRWESILREAERQAARALHLRKKLRVVFLRTPEQRKIPGGGWNVIGPRFEAAESWLCVQVIAKDELAAIHAAYDLFANTVEGNVPFDRAAALEFVRLKLVPWWQSFLQMMPSSPQIPPPPIVDPSKEMLEAIRAVLAAKWFLSLDQLVSSLSDRWPQDAVLAGCQRIPEVKIFSTAQATALKWKSSPSQLAS